MAGDDGRAATGESNGDWNSEETLDGVAVARAISRPW